MAGPWLTATSHRTLESPLVARPALTMTRRFVQGFGGLLVIGLAAALPWAEFEGGHMVIGRAAVPEAALGLLGVMVAAGFVFLSISTWGLVRRLKVSTRLLCLAALIVGSFSVAGVEYGYVRSGGWSADEYRGAVRMLGYAVGILLLSCAVPEEAGFAVAIWIKRHRPGRRSVIVSALIAVAAGGLVSRVALGGMPHLADGSAYLLEARTLWSGQLMLEAPRHTELFAGELNAYRTTDPGSLGGYPVGWPLVLGLFDAVGVAWLAGPGMAGALVGLTYFTVRQRSEEGLAAAAAIAAGLCPWLWMNSATMMPHVASAVWLMAFLGLMLGGVRRMHVGWLLGSGVMLGMAVLTRPGDAVFFALPALAYGLGKVVQSRRVWLHRMGMIPLGALPGVLAYVLIDRHQRGLSRGGSWLDALLAQMPASPGHAVVWLQESWAGLSGQWFAGALPAGLLMVCGLFFGRKHTRGQGLLLACCASLLVCYGVLVMEGRAWVGPRWYVPLIPGGAVLIVAGLLAAAQTARIACAEGVLAAGYLRTLTVAGFITAGVVLPMKLIELRSGPPTALMAGWRTLDDRTDIEGDDRLIPVETNP